MSKKICLAQEYSLVFQVSEGNLFVHDPGMTILPDGTYLAFVPLWIRGVRERLYQKHHVEVLRSKDKGDTWQTICKLPYAEATPIVVGEDLYLFTQINQYENVSFICSHDGGFTWDDPVVVSDLPLWNCQQNMVIRDNKLYWCMDKYFREVYAVCCDLEKGIMNPKAWRVSPGVALPEVPQSLIFGVAQKGWNTPWPGNVVLESNVVEVEGRMMVISRVVCDEYGTANLAAVFHIEDTDGELKLTFQQFYPLPGGQCKFNIVQDPKTKMFWMASNLAVNSLNLIDCHEKLLKTQFNGGPGNDRRILCLWYSLDALNWVPAGVVAKADTLLQSFMYPSMVIDGEDLIILSRSAFDSGCQHDADCATFHRVENFRSLALDIGLDI